MTSRKRQLFQLEDVVDMLMKGDIPEQQTAEDENVPPPKRTSLPMEPIKVPVKLDSSKFYSSPKPMIAEKVTKLPSDQNATQSPVRNPKLPGPKSSPLVASGRASALSEKSVNSPVAARCSLPSICDNLDSPKTPKWANIFFKQSPAGKKVESSDSKKLHSPFTSWLKKTQDKPGDTVTQSILDAGQKEFGVVQCPECFMVYELKSPSDELLHVKHHESLKDALKLNISSLKNVNPIRGIDGGMHIYQISKESNVQKQLASKCDAVISVINSELNHITDQVYLEKLSGKQKAFCCIDLAKSEIKGLCVVEPVARAYPTMSISWPIEVERDPRKTIAGIRLIWVAPDVRQKGIAKALMECVRSHFVYGCVLSKKEIAIAPPTIDGFNFFRGYLGGLTRPKNGDEEGATNRSTVFMIYEI